ncbi:MAG: hypothetical protein J7639_18210 [Paenibacillaceae bacterium]|nr:hypothetical protein [Paenibacillaceae bacterium]
MQSLAMKKRKKVYQMKMLYVMLLLPVVHLALFSYAPMYGVIIAFKDFRPGLGIWDSHWNQFAHFKEMMHDFAFQRALRNTFRDGLYFLALFPVIEAVEYLRLSGDLPTLFTVY